MSFASETRNELARITPEKLNELMYTDRPILEIALDNGFSSVSFFNRVFKDEYGQTRV